MAVMTLKISSKNLNQEVRYNDPIRKIILENKANFTVENLKEEVRNLTKKGKIAEKSLKIIPLTSISTLTLNNSVLANPLNPSLIPQSEIIEIFAYLTGIAAVAGVGISMLLMQSAGVYRMFPRKKREATEWSSDILKGLAQVLVAPILIGSIAILAYLLFGNSEWFIKPF